MVEIIKANNESIIMNKIGDQNRLKSRLCTRSTTIFRNHRWCCKWKQRKKNKNANKKLENENGDTVRINVRSCHDISSRFSRNKLLQNLIIYQIEPKKIKMDINFDKTKTMVIKETQNRNYSTWNEIFKKKLEIIRWDRLQITAIIDNKLKLNPIVKITQERWAG